jgi:hypothetical protein
MVDPPRSLGIVAPERLGWRKHNQHTWQNPKEARSKAKGCLKRTPNYAFADVTTRTTNGLVRVSNHLARESQSIVLEYVLVHHMWDGCGQMFD